MNTGAAAEISAEALINIATGKHFILLEEGVVLGRVKVINPEGQILQVTDRIFEPDPVQINREEFEKFFTAGQLQALLQYDADSALRMQREMESHAQPVRLLGKDLLPGRLQRSQDKRAHRLAHKGL